MPKILHPGTVSGSLPMARLACWFLVLALAACSEAETPANVGYVNDGELFYRVIGSGRDTVVVLHGGPGAGMNTVLPAVRPLADEYVLVLFDQRGGGRSELPADTSHLRPEFFVEDLEAVRRHFGIDRMNIFAHSFGSVLVAQYALSYPERLRRVVLHGATGPSQEEAVRVIRQKAAAAPPPADTVLARRSSELMKRLLSGSASEPVEACREYESITKELARARDEQVDYEWTQCDAPPEAVAYYFRYTAQLAPRYYGGWDFRTGLEAVSAPFLVVYGERDSLSIPEQQAWVGAVPHGRLLLVADAGKAALYERPDFVLSAVDTFFQGEWPVGAVAVDSSVQKEEQDE